jgi:hypothetical protein
MAIIASTLAQIKSDPLMFLGGAERVNECFAAVGHVWRDRLLDPANTMALFVQQVLHGNTAISHLRLLSGIDCSPGSYCDARTRLPVAGVAAVVEQLSCVAARCSESASTWLGRRIMMVDATTATAPDEPALQQIWPQPSEQKEGCGFPILKLLALVDLATGMILQMTMMALNVHEASQLAGPHGALCAGDILLGDRGFCSFGHLALLARLSVDAVFRMRGGQIIDFTPGRPARGKARKRKPYQGSRPASEFIRRLGEQDQIVQWTKPQKRPGGISAAVFAGLPQLLLVRELRYCISTKGMRTRQVTIATSLLDPMRYPKHEIARLYQLRWEIETNFRHLKTTMKMDHLKCQTAEGVLKELMVFALVYNLIRLVMTQAAARQRIADSNRMSFIDASRWLMSLLARPATGSPPLLITNPLRPGRFHPRVKKRRPTNDHNRMNKPRRDYSQPDEYKTVSD